MSFDNPRYFLTAYGIAVKHGFCGTEEEWLTSLTAYGMAVAMGFEGTEEEWLQKLNDPVPTLQIGEVVTLPGGADATVIMSGTKDAPVLNFGIPRGLGMADALPIGGGTMKGNLNMGGFQLTGLKDPVGDDEPVPKKSVDAIKNTADGALQKSGGTMTGDINMGEKRILELPQPMANKEAANKEYVDQFLSLTGGTITGAVSVPTPTQDSHAATKAYVDGKKAAAAAVLTAGGWTNNTQTVSVAGVTATNNVLVTSAPESYVAYGEAVIFCSGQGEGTLSFTCADVPGEDLTVNILIMN